jgi:hypothetical protein
LISATNPLGWGLIAGGAAYGMSKANSNLRERVKQAFHSHLEEYDQKLALELHQSVDSASSMSGSNQVEMLLDRISAMRHWSQQAQDICTDQRRKAETGLILIQHAEHQFTTLQSQLDEIERELDRVNLTPEADRIGDIKLENLIQVVQDTERHGRSDLSVLKVTLGEDDCKNLSFVKDYFSGMGIWRDPMEHRLASLWVICRQTIQNNPKAKSPSRVTKPEIAYRVVSAIAVAEGADHLPTHNEVITRYRDASYRQRLVTLFRPFGADEYANHIENDVEGNPASRGGNFIPSYKRMLINLDPTYLKTSPRDETVSKKNLH